MAFTGTLITCAYAAFSATPPLLGELVWSQHMSVAGECANPAPSPPSPNGPILVFEVYADRDIYVAYGASPDATSGPRCLVKATMTYDFVAKSGDKIAWSVA